MNPTTLTLIQIFGPVLFIMGISMLIRRDVYIDAMKNLINNAPFAVFAGVANLVVGIAILNTHNIWGTAPEVIVSLVGWLALIKGLHLTLSPETFFRTTKKLLNKSFMLYGGLVVTALGVYLSWAAYFA
jgi:hypothetical protein